MCKISYIIQSAPKGQSLLLPSVAVGVTAPLIGHGWPKGNPLKALFAQGTALGIWTQMEPRPVRAKALASSAFALSGRIYPLHRYPGRGPGLSACWPFRLFMLRINIMLLNFSRSGTQNSAMRRSCVIRELYSRRRSGGHHIADL